MGRDITVQLVALEATIERGLATFVEVGEALREIRDQRLYRERYATFEDYCRERWDFSRQRALQLIGGAAVTTVVVTAGLPAPATEGVARELGRAEPEQQPVVWTRALERGEGKPTAADVAAVRAELEPPSEPEPEPGKRKLKQHDKMVRGVVTDASNLLIVEPYLDLTIVRQIANGGEAGEWLKTLREARTFLSRVIAALSSDV